MGFLESLDRNIMYIFYGALFIIFLVLIISMVVEHRKNEATFNLYVLEDGSVVNCSSEDWYGELRALRGCEGGVDIINPKNVKRIGEQK